MRDDIEPAGGKGPCEHDFLRPLGNVDEPARTTHASAEAADIHVATSIHFCERKKGDVEPPAVVEVELVGLVHHGLVVKPCAGVFADRRYAAEDALLNREGDFFVEPFLGGDLRDAVRYAVAKIHHGARKKLHGSPPRNDFADVHWQNGNSGVGPANPAGVRRVKTGSDRSATGRARPRYSPPKGREP